MKIIISPAKKMNIDTDTMEAQGTPFFGTDAREDGMDEKPSLCKG